MKKILVFSVILTLVLASVAYAEIGWSGNIWPNSGSNQTNGDDITVYYQMWKDGVTPGDGPGDSLTATIYYKKSDETTFVSTAMDYLGEVGNNDEYNAIIPNTYFGSGDTIHFYCEGYDSTDGTYSYGTDQNNNGPFDADYPGEYYIVGGIQQDVTVTFQVDLSVVGPIEPVSVAGTFNGWTSGADTLSPQGDEVYAGDVTFAAGSNPTQEYKFVNGGNWEDAIGNRQLEIDDSSPTMVLPVVYFNDNNPADYTDQDVTVTFNVDVFDSVNAGYVFDSLGIYGSESPLDWSFGVINNPLLEIEVDSLWSGNVMFPEGTYRYINFKLGRNGQDLEAGFGENHSFEIDDTGTSQTVFVVYGDMDTPASVDPHPPINKRLIYNYPNPFSRKTTISFAAKTGLTPQSAKLVVYNLKGQVVNEIEVEASNNYIEFDGRDSNGNLLSSGIYFYKLKNVEENYINKMVIIR